MAVCTHAGSCSCGNTINSVWNAVTEPADFLTPAAKVPCCDASWTNIVKQVLFTGSPSEPGEIGGQESDQPQGCLQKGGGGENPGTKSRPTFLACRQQTLHWHLVQVGLFSGQVTCPPLQLAGCSWCHFWEIQEEKKKLEKVSVCLLVLRLSPVAVLVVYLEPDFHCKGGGDTVPPHERGCHRNFLSLQRSHETKRIICH